MYAPELGTTLLNLPGGGVTVLPDLAPVKVSDVTVQGRGSWMIPIAIGILAAYFIFYRGRGSRGEW